MKPIFFPVKLLNAGMDIFNTDMPLRLPALLTENPRQIFFLNSNPVVENFYDNLSVLEPSPYFDFTALC